MKRYITLGTLLIAAATLGLTGCSSSSGGGTPPPPTAQADSFTLAANVPATTIPAAIGVLANDPAGAAIIASDTQTTLGGTVTVNPDGSFIYEPPLGASGTDTFAYSIETADGTSSATVSIDVTGKVIFVDPAAAPGGNGHHATPFDTLAAGRAAASFGDAIFVKAGDGSPLNGNLVITLLPGQRLIGEAAGLSIEVKDGEWVEVVAPSVIAPLDPAPAPIYPRLATDATVIDSTVHMANGSELAGFSLQALGVLDAGTPLAEGMPTVSAAAVSDFKIHGNVIADPAGSGIATADVNGKGVITNNTITGATGEHAGIDLFFRLAASTAQLEVSGNTVTVVDGELAAAIDLVVRGDLVSHNVKVMMDGNSVRGGRGIDPAHIPPAPMPDIGILSRGLATVCVELTNNTSPDAGAVFAAEAVQGGTLQLATLGNVGTVEALGATLVLPGSCQ